jgi:nitrite reductase/ring-hydroxylating ferredoxin subunit/uncharacterized membrane protein
MMSLPRVFRAQLDRLMNRWPGFGQSSENVAQSLHQMVIEGGEGTRKAADVLHGKPVGHPLHPILTDITLGSWVLGTLFDLLGLFTFSRTHRKAANHLITLGTVTAVPTALTGLTDYSAIKKDAARYGAAHGIMNGIAFYLYFRSVKARFAGHYLRALFYTFVGLGFALVAAWLGGDLVYRHRVGVNHASAAAQIEDWTVVLPENELADGERRRVEVDSEPVLLYRTGGTLYAVGAVCSHAGGPLEEGKIDDQCVLCPWHDSVFDLRDGHVVHGPATFDLPAYEARINNGLIEVRRQKPELEPIIIPDLITGAAHDNGRSRAAEPMPETPAITPITIDKDTDHALQ